MKTLMDKFKIIDAKRRGLSNRETAKRLGIDRKTVAKYWNEYNERLKELNLTDSHTDIRELQAQIVKEPQYDVSSRGPMKYTEEIDALVETILEEEKEKSKKLGRHKQKRTLKQMHELVASHGHDIAYSTLSKYIKIKTDTRKEAYIRQEYEYGDRVEYDFGEVKLEINGVVSIYYMAVFGAPASKFRWAYLYPNQKKEVFMDSHVRFFEKMGGVYKEVVYDNMRNVVTKFIGKNKKELNEDLVNMSLYYGFEINVTNCFSGNEKGFVEASVKHLRKELFTKRYRFDHFEEAENYLEKELIKLNETTSRVQEEQKHLLPKLPALELGILTEQKVNKYSMIQVETNHYSVPEHLVGKWVQTKIYAREILVYDNSQLVAKHKKIDGFHQFEIDLYHYLNTLKRKPGALKHSKALKSKNKLKTIYDTYFNKREKEFIEILQKFQSKQEKVGEDELMEELVRVGRVGARSILEVEEEFEDRVSENTKKELEKLSALFMGDIRYVH